MENLKDKNLGFFMNYFSSLQIWDKFGMFEREISLYNRLAKNFKHIYVFSYGNKNDLKYYDRLEKNITIVPKTMPIPDILYEILLPFIYQKILRQCDIYKTNQNSGAIAPTIAKIIYRKKFIVRSGYIGSELAKLSKLPLYAKAYFWLAENFSYRFCDKAFIPTQTNYDILLKKYSCLKNKLLLMNNFIDTDLFKKEEREKKYDIIYVARFDKDKNHQLLLKVARDLGLNILFIGQGQEKEPLLRFQKENYLKLTIIDRISNDKMPAFYNSSKICVFPSLHEGNPKALLEAMSCALPISALDVIGVKNIIADGKNGLLSKTDDILGMKNNILKLLNDPASSQALGQSARKYIEENYSLDKLFLKELNLYREILNQ